MFGSGDDKKSKHPAPSVDTPVAATSTANEPLTKPAKKGLFSWFGKKTAEQQAVESSESLVAEVDQAEAVSEPEHVELASLAAAVEPATSVPVVETEPVLLDSAVASVDIQQVIATQPAQADEPSAAIDTAVIDEVQQAPTAATTQQPEQIPAPSADSARPAFSRFRISGGSEITAAPAIVEQVVAAEIEAAVDESQPALDVNLAGQDKPQDNKASWFARLKQGLAKTSSSLGEGMASLFLGKKEIDDDLLDELETRLLTADVGMEATSAIMANLTRRVARKELADSGALYQALQTEMADLLRPIEQPMQIIAEKKPYVILVVGVNGAGKTTTIGKLAARLQKEGKKVMLAAGDTFRAAAVEQLQVWGERNKIPVIAQHTGADSASVIFDAVQAAKARGMDVLIADTAGRLHTKDNLMEELRKVGRVMSKLDDSAPHEVLLVLDAGTGQNAINQARQFNETIPLTGLALTKLDGTAKGGVIFALAKHFQIPVRYIGVGEGIDDLRDFVADDFVKALFAEKDSA